MTLWLSNKMLYSQFAVKMNVKASVITVLMVIAYLFSLYIFSFYNLSVTIETRRSRKTLIFALAGGLLVVSVFNLWLHASYEFRLIFTHYILLAVCLYGWRIFFLKFIIIRGHPLRAIVFGDKPTLEFLINDFEPVFKNEFEIVGAYYKSEESDRVRYQKVEGYSTHEINDLLTGDNYDLVLYDTEQHHFEKKDIEAIIRAKFAGKAIYDIHRFYQDMTGKTPIEIIEGIWLIQTGYIQGREKRGYFRIKRLIDILLSLSLMVVLSPIILLIAICLKISGSEKILFLQERLCTHRDTFKCIKFHTMSVKTDPDAQQPQWATHESSRITPLGHILRKTRLDELPQLWNIFKGDMSFVGPRPIREYFANELAKEIPFYNLRFMVKPGLSGWAQVNLGYADSLDSQREKFTYELFYLQNMSFVLDVIIIFKTIQKVLRGEGA